MSFITVIDDYNFDLDSWVQENSSDFREPSMIPVQLYLNTSSGIECYLHDDTDTWYSSRIGQNDWHLQWDYVPYNCSSYDDMSGDVRSFSDFYQLISYISRGFHEEDYDDGYRSGHKVTNPFCSLPQFQSFHETDLCPDTYYSSLESKFRWTDYIPYSVRYFFPSLISFFMKDDTSDEYWDRSPFMELLQRIWNYVPRSDYPFQCYGMGIMSHRDYSSPYDEFNSLSRHYECPRETRNYWDRLSFNSMCYRTYLLFPESLRDVLPR